jgi:hypothetical protein
MSHTRTRTRFAPSPTGFIHLGNIRSALYPWAFARATEARLAAPTIAPRRVSTCRFLSGLFFVR